MSFSRQKRAGSEKLPPFFCPPLHHHNTQYRYHAHDMASQTAFQSPLRRVYKAKFKGYRQEQGRFSGLTNCNKRKFSGSTLSFAFCSRVLTFCLYLSCLLMNKCARLSKKLRRDCKTQNWVSNLRISVYCN